MWNPSSTFMSQREAKWKQLLEEGPLSDAIQNWLLSDDPYFQITSSDFRRIGAKPVRLIPTYSAEQLPNVLLKYGLEQIRNQAGGCVLVKHDLNHLPTLFPRLPEINQIILDQPPKFPVSLKLLQHEDLHNEETGIVLANEMGIYSLFFKRAIGSEEHFTLGGRIKTTVNGEFLIAGHTVPVERCLLEIDNFMESSSYIVPIEAKIENMENDRTSFSIHQFALPTLLLSQLSNKRMYSLFQIYSVTQTKLLNFRLYLYDINYSPGRVTPHSYRFVDGVCYTVPFPSSLFG